MPKAVKKVQVPGFAVIADVHVANRARFGGEMVDGVNARCRLILRALREAVGEALQRGCETLFVAGDLFDTRRPEPAVIAAVQVIFGEARKNLGIRVVIVPGNHDMVDADAGGGNTACAPLWQSAEVVLKPTVKTIAGHDVLLIPFTAKVAMAQHLMEVLKTVNSDDWPWTGKPRVLVTHVGVWDEATATPWQKRAKDGISSVLLLDLMEEAGIDVAYVGNYHEHRVWMSRPANLKDVMRTIIQVGTLCPGSFGDAGLKDRGLMWVQKQDGERSHYEIPGPRFVIAEDRLAGVFSAGVDERTRYFIRAGSWLVQREGWGGVEIADDILPLSGPSNGGGKEEATGLDPLEALGSHVEQMQLPEGVDRGAVMALVKDCWTKGA